jgi:hypothetical protein
MPDTGADQPTQPHPSEGEQPTQPQADLPRLLPDGSAWPPVTPDPPPPPGYVDPLPTLETEIPAEGQSESEPTRTSASGRGGQDRPEA